MLYGITVAIAWFMLPATDRMSRCSQVVDSVGVIGRRILSQIVLQMMGFCWFHQPYTGTVCRFPAVCEADGIWTGADGQ